MSNQFLDDRRQALEDAFFTKQQADKINALKGKLEKKKSLEELREVSGMDNDAVLQKLVDIGTTGDTVAAIALVPLVQVAWADNEIQDAEREAILDAAHEKGVDRGTAPYDLLVSWLEKKPTDDLYEAWAAYVGALGDYLEEQQLESLRDDIVEFATEVAAAAGGVLGFKKVSGDEKAVLEKIAAAFSSGS